MTIRRSRAVLSVGVGSAVVLVGFAFVIRRVAEQWDDVRRQLADARPAWVVAALLLAIAGMGTIGLRWARCLELMGVSQSRWSVLRWFATGQLGKYVPGGIWHVVGQGPFDDIWGELVRFARPQRARPPSPSILRAPHQAVRIGSVEAEHREERFVD